MVIVKASGNTQTWKCSCEAGRPRPVSRIMFQVGR